MNAQVLAMNAARSRGAVLPDPEPVPQNVDLSDAGIAALSALLGALPETFKAQLEATNQALEQIAAQRLHILKTLNEQGAQSDAIVGLMEQFVSVTGSRLDKINAQLDVMMTQGALIAAGQKNIVTALNQPVYAHDPEGRVVGVARRER